MTLAKNKVFVAGHNGMVGSAIVRKLSLDTSIELVLASRSELDLLDASAVARFFDEQQPDQVYLAAARVGGIHANNTYPAEFISQNLQIQNIMIQAAHNSGVQQLLFLGSSCIYPKLATQPIVEEALLTGQLESTNEPYAIAKIAGIKMCESFNRQYGRDYRSVMPTNLYGQNDNFHPQNSHVIPGMLRRFHDAKLAGSKKITVWGTGRPKREFLHVDDMATACIHVMNVSHDQFNSIVSSPMCSHVNVGSGRDVTIAELAGIIAKVVGFEGDIEFDGSKPDGAPRKLMDVGRLRSLGWEYSLELEKGIYETYVWFLDNQEKLRT
jgi:GDP-L-fucose synthase